MMNRYKTRDINWAHRSRRAKTTPPPSLADRITCLVGGALIACVMVTVAAWWLQ